MFPIGSQLLRSCRRTGSVRSPTCCPAGGRAACQRRGRPDAPRRGRRRSRCVSSATRRWRRGQTQIHGRAAQTAPEPEPKPEGRTGGGSGRTRSTTPKAQAQAPPLNGGRRFGHASGQSVGHLSACLSQQRTAPGVTPLHVSGAEPALRVRYFAARSASSIGAARTGQPMARRRSTAPAETVPVPLTYAGGRDCRTAPTLGGCRSSCLCGRSRSALHRPFTDLGIAVAPGRLQTNAT